MKKNKSICAIVPAAGRGSRLNMKIPKVFLPITKKTNVWDLIKNNLSPFVDEIILILSPFANSWRKKKSIPLSAHKNCKIRAVIQKKPKGMADAIFNTTTRIDSYQNILIVWGDQANVSQNTIRRLIKLHFKNKEKKTISLPLVQRTNPYVKYILNKKNQIESILQKREGDNCGKAGLSDIGVFLISGGKKLKSAWNQCQKNSCKGATTGEQNFLPFLQYLSYNKKWCTKIFEIKNKMEGQGINTKSDYLKVKEELSKIYKNI